MEPEPESTSLDVLMSIAGGHANGNGDAAVNQGTLFAACSQCRRVMEPDNDVLEIISLCGDCRFLLFEDLGTPEHSHQRRPRRGRRARYSSSESTENVSSHHLWQMMSMAVQNQSTISGNEDQSVESDGFASLFPRTINRTPPGGSRRWHRVLSDTESEGFDNMDSPYGESDINFRSGRYRIFHSESDAISFSAYGGDSDASVDGNSFLDTEMFTQADAASNLDSDTDIDPMHAGLNQWDSEEEDEEDEWEEADEEDAVEAAEARAQLQNLFNSSPSGVNGRANWSHQLHSPEFGGTFRRTMRQENLGDYVRGFEQALEALAETDITSRAAPPAASSFVHNLPRVIINEEREKHDGLACAICKDALTNGTVVNQLPCLHVYHPFCIMPWLRARNSCPLCRYELPTDDKDYEERKQNTGGTVGIHEIRLQDANEDSSSDVSDGNETDEPDEHGQIAVQQPELVDVDTFISTFRQGSGRGWFFLAAAPIVSLLGLVLVLWLDNPGGRGPTGQCNLPGRSLHGIQVPGPSQPNQRANRRRWWFPF